MIDYTQLPYTERLLYVSHFQKQPTTALAPQAPIGRPALPAGSVPGAPSAAPEAGLAASTENRGLRLEKLLFYGALLAGAGLLAYGLYQYMATTSLKSTIREQEN
jgi:hypothetical protein